MSGDTILWAVAIGGAVSAVHAIRSGKSVWTVAVATFAVGLGLYAMGMLSGEFAGMLALLFLVTSLLTNGAFLISTLNAVTGVTKP